MNTIDSPVSELAPTGKNAAEMWEAVTMSLDKVLAVLSERDTMLDPTEADAALDIYSQALNDISALAADYRSPGLVALSERMSRHVSDMREQGRGLRHDDLDFLEQWPIHLATYLTAPHSASTMQALVAHLQDHHWPNPLPPHEGEAMIELLQRPTGIAVPADRGPAIDDASGPDDCETSAAVEEAVVPAGEIQGNAGPADGRAADAAAEAAPLLEEIANLLATAEQFGVLGLQEICLRVQHNIARYQEANGLDNAVLDMLSRFPPLAYDYLASPAPEAAAALVEFLQGDHWPAPLDVDEAEAMLFLLQDGFAVPALDDAASPQAVGATDEAGQTTLPQADVVTDDETHVAVPQSVSSELMALFNQELLGMQTELAHMLDEALLPDQSDAQRRELIQNYAEQLERIGMGAEAVGLASLSRFADSLHRRIRYAAAEGLTSRQHEALALLPGSLRAYLAAPDDPSTGAGLIDLLQGDTWKPAPAPGYLSALIRGLAMVELTEDAQDAVARQTQAQPEDVVLTLPADLNQELLDGLLLELPVHTGEFSAAIQHLAAGAGTLADIDVAKRAAHTLKGAANTVGIKGIATLTHHVEDILIALSKHAALPSRALAETLSNAGDCLEAMGEAVMGTGPEPDYAVAVVQEVLDWANRIDREGVPTADDEMALAPSAASRSGSGEDAGAAAATPLPHHEAMVRVPASLIDELLRLMGENIISTGQVRERLRRLAQQNRLLQQQNQVFLQLAIELEELVDLRDAGRTFGPVRAGDDFDPLEFERYSELHTVSRRLIEAATDAGELSRDAKNELGELNELVEVQSRLHTQSQNTVLRTRMVPVATIVSRMQRSVRQAARLLDKQVALQVNGADTMVDSNILNDLADPLMHMLRNAVDHGIEFPAQRAAAGKPGEGRIELSFLREGNQVVVRCRDDGAGLDLAAIRRNAEEKGLLAAGQVSGDDELARLIFEPGFSTRSESTQVSGRGIGMDVVHSRVLQLKGMINLHGTPGRGLEIEIRLPATLISTYALLVRARQHVFAISSYGIHDIHYVTPDQVQGVGSEQFFRVGEEIYPLADFSALLNLPQSRRSNERDEGFPVLLVRQDGGAVHAVRVQEIIDSSELVVKGFGRYVPKPHGVVGATILGDGSVAAVIDLPEVMRKPVRATKAAESPDAHSSRNDAAGGRPSRFAALVVDDSLSARRATAQFMKDAGFDVRTAIDGLEAISILDKWKPNILLVDMEMPRMNGLELTAHIRARAGMERVPVVMITSRSTEKHRQQAETAGVNVYLTKPFSDDELLKHVMELTAT